MAGKDRARQIREALIANGFELKIARGGHWIAKHKDDGQTIYVLSGTPGGPRSIANDLATIRRTERERGREWHL